MEQQNQFESAEQLMKVSNIMDSCGGKNLQFDADSFAFHLVTTGRLNPAANLPKVGNTVLYCFAFVFSLVHYNSSLTCRNTYKL